MPDYFSPHRFQGNRPQAAAVQAVGLGTGYNQITVFSETIELFNECAIAPMLEHNNITSFEAAQKEGACGDDHASITQSRTFPQQ